MHRSLNGRRPTITHYVPLGQNTSKPACTEPAAQAIALARKIRGQVAQELIGQAEAVNR